MSSSIQSPGISQSQGLINFKSPIFWRITAGVFASILLIEAALLIFSWFTERGRLLTRLDESLVTVTSLLDHDNPLPQLEQLIANNSSLPNYEMITRSALWLTNKHRLTIPAQMNPTQVL